MRDIATLCMNGIAYADAVKMSAARRLAFIVAFGELKGSRFDWDRLRWEEPK